jgi:hypothetical protein
MVQDRYEGVRPNDPKTRCMVSSTKNAQPKKTRGGRPRVGSTHMMLTIPPSLLAELDVFRDQQLDKPSRQEAIRQLMVQALSASKKKR